MKIIKALLSVIAVLVLAGGAAFFFMAQGSKDGSAPGLADGRLAPCPDAPNCVSSEVDTAPEKFVDVLPSASWDVLPEVIAQQGGVVVAEQDGYIAAEFTSATLGFVDDFEARLSEDGVHVRSASRVGYSDAGVNAARVADIRAALSQ